MGDLRVLTLDSRSGIEMGLVKWKGGIGETLSCMGKLRLSASVVEDEGGVEDFFHVGNGFIF